MQEIYPLSLALFDLVPIFAFLAGAYFLVKTSLVCRGKPCGRMMMMMAGALLVFLGDFFKATWKLFYTFLIADIRWMSQGQFVFSSIGFLGICVGVIYMVRGRKAASTPGGVMASMAPWKIPFLFVMTLASLGAEGILAYLAGKRGVRAAAIGFVVGVMGLVAMGALASAEQTLVMQWIEEVVNTIGQAGFMLGSIFLYKDFESRGCDLP